MFKSRVSLSSFHVDLDKLTKADWATPIADFVADAAWARGLPTRERVH
jgi:hypothetical protein